MQSESRELFVIILFIAIGLVGLPAGIYQWVLLTRNGWICYSKHGHILESVTGCKFNLFSGLLLATAALSIGLYQAWKRP